MNKTLSALFLAAFAAVAFNAHAASHAGAAPAAKKAEEPAKAASAAAKPASAAAKKAEPAKK
jgi:hypothetical protein